MSVLINFKICDNAKECGGIEVCPTGALSYDEEKQTIVTDNSKCISCGLCVGNCPMGAIHVASTKEEYNEIKKEIDNDPRTVKELFVNRYGGVPISSFHTISFDGLQKQVNNGDFILVEVFNDDSIECLAKSIPVKEILDNIKGDPLYYKLEDSEEVRDMYGINKLPSLLVFKDKVYLGKVDGYYTNDNTKTFIKKIKKILK
jgi:NAD-dependent dihydropyrimidine dehydrogenase PreA subunit